MHLVPELEKEVQDRQIGCEVKFPGADDTWTKDKMLEISDIRYLISDTAYHISYTRYQISHIL